MQTASIPAYSLSLVGFDTISKLYVHYWHNLAAKLVVEDELLKRDYEPSSRREFKRILETDTEHFNNTVTAYAWCIVNEEDQWGNLKDLPIKVKGMVEDERDRLEKLHYGLITRYYTPVQRYASYVCGYSQRDEIQGFASVDIDYLNNTTFNRTLDVLKSMERHRGVTAETLRHAIKDVCMTFSPEDYDHGY